MADNLAQPLPPFHKIMRQAFTEIANLAFKPAVESLPATLFHYTSSAGLLGIVGSGELWATHAAHLNDSSEVTFAEERLRECLASTKPGPGLETRFLEKLAWGTSADFTMTTLFDVYAASFCESDDLLSMWRGYGSEGYAVGFSTSSLATAAADGFESQPSWLARVLYEPSDQRAFLTNLINGTLAVAKAVPGHIAREGLAISEDDALDILMGNFLSSVVPFLCFIKHPGFREERECRVVQVGWTIANYPEGIHLRAGPAGLVPYVRLHPRGASRFELTSVRVGPSGAPEIAKRAAERLLGRHGETNCPVTVSTIPLRA